MLRVGPWSGRQATRTPQLSPPRHFLSLSRACFLVGQAKVVHVSLDGSRISPPDGFLIRKGPGHCHFDFAQEVLFVDYLQAGPRLPQPARR